RGRRPPVRNPRRLRRAARPSARAGDPDHRRPRPEPHLGPAPVVRRVALEPDESEARLVRLGRPEARRIATERLAVGLQPGEEGGLDARPDDRPGLPPPVPALT